MQAPRPHERTRICHFRLAERGERRSTKNLYSRHLRHIISLPSIVPTRVNTPSFIRNLAWRYGETLPGSKFGRRENMRTYTKNSESMTSMKANRQLRSRFRFDWRLTRQTGWPEPFSGRRRRWGEYDSAARHVGPVVRNRFVRRYSNILWTP